MISNVFGGVFMAHVIAIVNQKGGVGKTAVCRTLSTMLHESNYKCLLIDFDPQQTLSLSLGVVKNRFDEDTPSMYHVLNNEMSIKDAIIHTEQFDFIRSDYRMYSYNGTPLISREKALELRNNPAALYSHVIENLDLQSNPNTDDRHKLRRELDKISSEYYFIIIDTNPDLGALSSLVFLSSSTTNILIPAFPEESSRQSVIALHNTIQTILANDLSQRINILGILISRFEKNNISKKYLTYFKRLANNMNTTLFNSLIPKSVLVYESMALKQSLFDRRKKAPIIDEYRAFYKEFLQKIKQLEKGN